MGNGGVMKLLQLPMLEPRCGFSGWGQAGLNASFDMAGRYGGRCVQLLPKPGEQVFMLVCSARLRNHVRSSVHANGATPTQVRVVSGILPPAAGDTVTSLGWHPIF